MKCVVTGALGQDGSYLIENLYALGYEVIGLIRQGSQKEKKENFNLLENKCRLIECDLNSLEIQNIVKKFKPNRFFHLAASHISSTEKPQNILRLQREMIETNFTSLENIARAILENNPSCRLFYAGSLQQYKAIDHGILKIDETTLQEPSTFYGQTKIWGQNLVSFYRKNHGLWGCTGVLFNHESPRRESKFITRHITKSVASIKEGKSNEIVIKYPNSLVDWSHAEDVVQAIYKMLEVDSPKDYIIGSGKQYSVLEFTKRACKIGDINFANHCQSAINDKSKPKGSLISNPRKIKNELNWEAKFALNDIIKDMLQNDLDLSLIMK
ncbi:GDP-mannose 4,6-dehydratase [Bacteriovoracales bacterium]|nr:GDP-mannose 4,6-dehydratase [Bacteriovoracales bacterium]